MVSSSATKNSRLLNPWALAVVAVAVGGLLWATFQRESVFQPDGREPDAVSANYAELLLTAHPDDDRLRLQLVDLVIRLGDYAKAREHIEAWPTPQLETQAYYRLELDALVAASGNDLIAQPADLYAGRQGHGKGSVKHGAAGLWGLIGVACSVLIRYSTLAD